MLNPRAPVLSVVLSLFLSSLSCDVPPQGPLAPISERQELAPTTSPRSLGFGSDCGQGRSASCLSGACLRTRVRNLDFYRCSRSCNPDVGCDPGWSCQQVYPSHDAWFCLPQPAKAWLVDAGADTAHGGPPNIVALPVDGGPQ